MIGRSNRRFGPPWAQREWDGPRDPRFSESRGHHEHRHEEHHADYRPNFGPRFFGPRGFRGHHGHHHEGHQHSWHNASPEQQALRSTAAEVAHLFMIASRSSDSPEKRARLRAFLDRSRTELAELIYGNEKKNEAPETPDVSQA